MSITKFENAKRELISQVDIDSKNLSANSSRCSCINCDSEGCFEKRKKAVKDSCQCGICRNLRKSSSLHNKASRKTKSDLENTTKKIIREVVTRETTQSLKRVTETMYEFGTNANFGLITERKSKLSDKKKIPTPKISQISITLECCKKRSTGNSDITTKKEYYKQRPIVKIPSKDVSQQYQEGNITTKLSAQIMNVPYEDLHETVHSSHELTEQNPLSKLNVFKRIKEIYEACSCKVCECISSKPRDVRDDICECKPCQCQDCVKLRKNIEENIRRIPHLGCPCIRCDRKDCRGIAKNSYEPQICDCNPSDSVQYPVNIIKRCKCEPCQCLNCRLLQNSKTVRLGQVDEFIQRETCQCSPCECIECKQIYNRTNPTIMYTHAKDMNKFGSYNGCHNCRAKLSQLGKTDTCKCDRHNNKIMGKAFHKNYNDYDIRTVIVDNNGSFNKPECEFIKQNNIALFASLENTYPNNICNKGVCKCTDCECIVCSGKNDSLRKYSDHFRHNIMSMHNSIDLSTSIINACKCSPCECEICSKKGEHEDSIAFERKCICEVCDCLNCVNVSLATSSFPSSSAPHQYIDGRQPAKPIRSIEMNKNCDCNSCDCSNCKKLFSCSSSVKFYSDGKSVEKKIRRLRKVLLITPSTSESHLKTRKTYVQSVSSTTFNPKQSIAGVYRQNLSTCHGVSQNYAPVGHLSHANKNEVCQLYQDSNVTSDDDADGKMFFKLNNPILDTTSLKSTEETPIMNNSCGYNESPFKTLNLINHSHIKRNEAECKSFFNIINEHPDKITSNDSDASLPVYWTCCNGSSYPKSYSRNIKITCERTKSNPKTDSLNNTQCSKNKQDDLKEKPKQKTTHLILMDKSKSDDAFCDDERVKLQQESYKYTDSFISPVIDNLQGYRKSTVNLADFTIDYERATIVLREAKAFSSKLMKMLDSFEAANRQFESASQKFKVVHESLLDINERKLNKTNSVNLRQSSRPIFENTFRIISEVNDDNNQSTDEGIEDENEAEREYEQSTNKPKDVDDNFEYIENSSTHYTSETKNITKLNDIDSIININMIQKLHSKSQFEIFNKIDILPTTKTSQIQIVDSPNLDSKETDFNIEDTNQMENKNYEINKQTPTISSIMKNLDSIYGNIAKTDTAVATDDVEKNPVELSEQQDKQVWQIFKKNLYLTARPRNKRTIFQSPALELDMKEAIQAISLQTTNENYAKGVPRPNEALANLQTEVNDLLNMPMLQINSQFKCESDANFFPRTKLDLEVKSLSSTASSQTYNRVIERADKEVYFNIDSETSKATCDQLKANFIGLRRVSDHTVLVKWAVPKRIADVQGYELLVDGRAVQKIFSPTRNMAVVTCLPHATRVLLTIRTIAAADCGHEPSSTIVYRPRMK